MTARCMLVAMLVAGCAVESVEDFGPSRLARGGSSTGGNQTDAGRGDAGVGDAGNADFPPLIPTLVSPVTEWWLLVHPNGTPSGLGGIYLWREGSAPVKRFELPSDVTSPHGLADDGSSLWLTAIDAELVMELDRNTGAKKRGLVSLRSEGLVVDGTALWLSESDLFASEQSVRKIDHTGATIKRVATGLGVIQDITTNGAELFVLQNGANDSILGINPVTGALRIVSEEVGVASYALGWNGKELVVIDAFNNNSVTRIDSKTGQIISSAPIGMGGWITAMAPVIRR